MLFKVLSVFAQAGLRTDDETYMVVALAPGSAPREIYSTKQSELMDGQTAETLQTAFTMAWDSVRAARHSDHWQLQIRRYPEFDGGQSGWENGDRVFGDQDDVDSALEERRGRHALYLLAVDPVYVTAAFNRMAVPLVAQEAVYQESPPRERVKVPLTVPVARL